MSILIGVCVAIIIVAALIGAGENENWYYAIHGAIAGIGIAIAVLAIGIPVTINNNKAPQKIIKQTIIKHDTVYVSKPSMDF
jgi:uncharacterized membrane protein